MTLRLKDSAADMRTDMELGTAAVLDVGTDAGDIVQLDSSAKIPALNGSALTGISTNLPIFFAKNDSSISNISEGTATEIGSELDEKLDTGGCFDTTNGRFTPNVPGKYFVSTQQHIDCGSGNLQALYGWIKKNGDTIITTFEINETSGNANEATGTCSAIIQMNGDDDYLECYMQYSSTADNKAAAAHQTNFYAYRISA